MKEKFIEINLIKTDIYKLLKDKSFNNYTLNSIYTESSKNYLKLDNRNNYFKNTFINNVDENTFTLTFSEPNKLLNIDYGKTKIIYINKKDLSIHKSIIFHKGIVSGLVPYNNKYITLGSFSYVDLVGIFKRIFNIDHQSYYYLLIDLRNPDQLNSKYLKESKLYIKQLKDSQIIKQIKITNLDIQKENNDLFYIKKYPNNHLKIETQKINIEIVKNPNI